MADPVYGNILIEAQIAERTWTDPSRTEQLQMCLAAAQVCGELEKVQKLLREFRGKLTILNRDRTHDDMTVQRLAALSLDRAVRQGKADAVMVYGAILALDRGLKATKEQIREYTQVRRLSVISSLQ